MRVLVTDGHFRKSLAVVRSLGRKGVQVTVGERTSLNTSFFSRFCHRRFIYPSPRRYPDQFIQCLLREITERHRSCLFPMEEETLLVIAKYRSDISKQTYLLIPDLQKIELVRDKGKLLRFAELHGIPVPRTCDGPDGDIQDLPLPAVIKPRISSGAFGIIYVQNREDLFSSYQRVHQRYPFPLIQEYIPDGGGTFGVSALFDESSHVKAAFVHKKLRMYPVQGGPSTLREGVEHPHLMELGLSLLKALNWVGVAMVEFKVDPRDGLPKLMEVNPRFWGSLQLAIFSGVDFPHLILKMAKGEGFDPVLRYVVGRRSRWLLFGDLLHFFKNPERFHLQPSFFRFFEPNTCDDIISREDPLPILGAAATFFTFLYDSEMKRFLERR